MNNNKHKKGFTLLEMIVVLLLVVVLMAWGIPNYQTLKANRMVTDFSNEIVYSLTQARAEAVRYGTTVEMIANGGDWNDGWQTLARGVDGAADTVIAEQDPIDERFTLTKVGNDIGRVIFNNIGGLEGSEVGRFTLSNRLGQNPERDILVNFSGSVKVIKP